MVAFFQTNFLLFLQNCTYIVNPGFPVTFTDIRTSCMYNVKTGSLKSPLRDGTLKNIQV